MHDHDLINKSISIEERERESNNVYRCLIAKNNYVVAVLPTGKPHLDAKPDLKT